MSTMRACARNGTPTHMFGMACTHACLHLVWAHDLAHNVLPTFGQHCHSCSIWALHGATHTVGRLATCTRAMHRLACCISLYFTVICLLLKFHRYL